MPDSKCRKLFDAVFDDPDDQMTYDPPFEYIGSFIALTDLKLRTIQEDNAEVNSAKMEMMLRCTI